MKYAVNHEGQIIEAGSSSGEGECPACGGRVMPVLPALKVNHWRHQPEAGCPLSRMRAGSRSWKETAWHIRWKFSFPAETREITHPRGYRPDVTLPGGIELEFQTSPLSQIEVRERLTLKGRWPVVIAMADFQSWDWEDGRRGFYDPGAILGGREKAKIKYAAAVAGLPEPMFLCTEIRSGYDRVTGERARCSTHLPRKSWLPIARASDFWLDPCNGDWMFHVEHPGRSEKLGVRATIYTIPDAIQAWGE